MGGTIKKEELEKAFEEREPISEEALNRVFEMFEIEERAPVIKAVCDAIEGFCAAGCEWTRGQYEDAYTHKAGCNKYIYRASAGYIFDNCPSCNRRVIERFEILEGGEG